MWQVPQLLFSVLASVLTAAMSLAEAALSIAAAASMAPLAQSAASLLPRSVQNVMLVFIKSAIFLASATMPSAAWPSMFFLSEPLVAPTAFITLLKSSSVIFPCAVGVAENVTAIVQAIAAAVKTRTKRMEPPGQRGYNIGIM